MKALKALTPDRRTFFDGKQLDYGWHREDGPKNGKICRPGGYHIYFGEEFSHVGGRRCPQQTGYSIYEVVYRKKDILGQKGNKLRVRAFKLLKKKPVKEFTKQQTKCAGCLQEARRYPPRQWFTPNTNTSTVTSMGTWTFAIA